jgi:spore coat polysaccharide biosynthesis protein SpsF
MKKYRDQCLIIEGDELDVLARYVKASNQIKPAYIVRLTADCVFMPPHLISKHIKAAVLKNRDYTTNTWIRTWMEGFDVEVLSQRLLEWLDENAKGEDREHVTSLIKSQGYDKFPFADPFELPNVCHILNDIDMSFFKTSIDTEEDLKKAVDLFDRIKVKRCEAKRNGVVVQ